MLTNCLLVHIDSGAPKLCNIVATFNLQAFLGKLKLVKRENNLAQYIFLTRVLRNEIFKIPNYLCMESNKNTSRIHSLGKSLRKKLLLLGLAQVSRATESAAALTISPDKSNGRWNKRELCNTKTIIFRIRSTNIFI